MHDQALPLCDSSDLSPSTFHTCTAWRAIGTRMYTAVCTLATGPLGYFKFGNVQNAL